MTKQDSKRAVAYRVDGGQPWMGLPGVSMGDVSVDVVSVVSAVSGMVVSPCERQAQLVVGITRARRDLNAKSPISGDGAFG